MDESKVYTLSVNIPIYHKNAFDEWNLSCIQEHQNNRWNKIISDHYKAKEVSSKLNYIIECLDRLEQ